MHKFVFLNSCLAESLQPAALFHFVALKFRSIPVQRRRATFLFMSGFQASQSENVINVSSPTCKASGCGQRCGPKDPHSGIVHCFQNCGRASSCESVGNLGGRPLKNVRPSSSCGQETLKVKSSRQLRSPRVGPRQHEGAGGTRLLLAGVQKQAGGSHEFDDHDRACSRSLP